MNDRIATTEELMHILIVHASTIYNQISDPLDCVDDEAFCWNVDGFFDTARSLLTSIARLKGEVEKCAVGYAFETAQLDLVSLNMKAFKRHANK